MDTSNCESGVAKLNTVFGKQSSTEFVLNYQDPITGCSYVYFATYYCTSKCISFIHHNKEKVVITQKCIQKYFFSTIYLLVKKNRLSTVEQERTETTTKAVPTNGIIINRY